MRRSSHVLSCALALTSTVAAQQTYIVDALGSGQFTDIPPAIGAAMPGDTIRVRPGTYTGFTVSKTLRILGEPGVRVIETRTGGHGVSLPAIAVADLPADSAVTIAGMMATSAFSPFPNPVVTVTDSLGRVHFEDLRAAEVGARDAAQVTVHRCDFAGARFLGSDVVITQSTIGPQSPSGTRTITCTGGVTSISDSVVSGVIVAIELVSGELTVTGPRTTVTSGVGGGSPLFPPGAAIETLGGHLRTDPAVTLIPGPGHPAVSGPASHLVQSIPSIHVDVQNGQLTTSLHAPGALRGHTLLSLPQTKLPTPFGSMWLSIPHLVLDTGDMPAAGVRTRTLNLPPVGFDLEVVIQGLVAQPGALVFSVPVVVSL